MAVQNGSSETGNNNGPASSDAGESKQSVEQNVGGAAQEAPKRLSLAELFAEDDEGTIHESGDGDDDPSKPVDSIDGLIKRHKLTAEQVYAIKVPMANGAEPITLGKLKDRVGELVDLETRELQFDNRRVKAEGELLRAQTEMRELLALVPKDQIKPEMVEKIRRRHEATQAAERRATLEHIPEWQDEERRTKELQSMVELVEDYGFGAEFLTTVVDHRAIKMIRDYMLMRTRIQKALANVKDGKQAKGQRPSGKTGKAAAKPGAAQPRAKPGDSNAKLRSLFGDN
jgi:hypothetical protein